MNIEGLDKDFFFGYGAGWYLDATTEPYKKNFNMYTYITKELVSTVENFFPVDKQKRSVFGHSCGAHGAMISALKNPGIFKLT